MGGPVPPSNAWLLGPTQVNILNSITIDSLQLLFAGLMVVTDSQGDQQTTLLHDSLHL